MKKTALSGPFCLLLVLACGRSLAAPFHPSREDANTLDAELKAAITHAPDATRWPENDAALLLDLGNVTVQPDGTTIAEFRHVYKLFNKRARKLAEVNVPYNQDCSVVEVLRARTISPTGKIHNVSPKDQRVVSYYNEYALYDDSVALNFSMPAIEDNCLIDYTYRITTLPYLFPNQHWYHWRFTGLTPVGVSRLIVKTPNGKPFRFQTYNRPGLKPTIRDSVDKKSKVYTWEVKDAPPLLPEPDMPEAHETAA